jgi:hypothetical protein
MAGTNSNSGLVIEQRGRERGEYALSRCKWMQAAAVRNPCLWGGKAVLHQTAAKAALDNGLVKAGLAQLAALQQCCTKYK